MLTSTISIVYVSATLGSLCGWMDRRAPEEDALRRHYERVCRCPARIILEREIVGLVDGVL